MKLNRIYKEYQLPLKLYENVKRSLCYQNSTDIDDLQEFVESLPQDLRIEVSLFVFEKTFKKIEYLKDRPVAFIAWICPLLKPQVKTADQYIYYENDDISCIYFLKNGKAGYVLPRYKNLMYVALSRGGNFGVSCIVGSFVDSGDFHIDDWIKRRDCLKR